MFTTTQLLLLLLALLLVVYAAGVVLVYNRGWQFKFAAIWPLMLFYRGPQ